VYDYGADQTQPVKTGGLTTEHACAALILTALGFLILIRRGFRGVGVPGIGNIKVS
jgi:hypothetical protein